MSKRLPAILAALWLVSLTAASPASAAFGIDGSDVTFTGSDGSPAMQAGSHPYAFTTTIFANTKGAPGGGVLPDDEAKDITIDFPPGLVGTPTPVPRCAGSDFARNDVTHPFSYCPPSSAIGVATPLAGFTEITSVEEELKKTEGNGIGSRPVYNLLPAPGAASKLGFVVLGAPVTVETFVNPDPPYNLVTHVTNIPDFFRFFASKVTLWGVPADPSHDQQRGLCGAEGCHVNLPEVPFLTLPTSCTGPLRTTFTADSWQNPGVWTDPVVAETHDALTPPNPLGLSDCDRLGFGPTISAKPTTLSAGSPTGLDFSLDVNDEGLTNPHGLADSQVKRAEVTLPDGFSVNPSIAEGLNVCSETDLARETASSAPGAGCPNASKIGTVEVETPLLDENVNGALYQATPYQNRFGSLIAIYMVIKNPTLGIVIKQPIKVEPDPKTGRLTTIADEIPQLPFSHFKLHFREGTRSPLATPSGCGSYSAQATLHPWSGGGPITTASSFEIISGPDAGPCPSGGTPPFHPGLIAGSINNAAGAYSPFNVRLTRTDSEQEITHFSIKLPPGITGKLAGIPFCSDQAIGAAKAREGQPHGGQEEIEGPSCPQASEVGHTLVGSGVGPSLAYVPGKLYLAGPYNGAPLSIVAITAAKAGPFDLGTVVVREALRINPETAEVFVDATGSDPIPHIIHGIPVHLRDIRIYTDRPDFVLNPTSCNPTSTASTVLGSGTNFVSEADDQPVTVATRYQAADCASLPYKPSISLKLKGGTKRGGNPALTAILKPRPGDANSKKVSVALPHSEFLDQAHIKTICTRVQFKAGAGNGSQCPPASVYGKAKAWTPLLSEPLEGPIFLRSSEHPLPDLVLALHGLVDFTAVGRIDSVNGGIRNTFETVPDAPITKVEVLFPGGKKSLLENSTNICLGKHKATVEFGAQSGKEAGAKVALKPQCKGKARQKKDKKGRRLARASAFGLGDRAW